MNRLSKSLLVGLLEQENYITGFYGGGFKPPTKGHFAVVDKVFSGVGAMFDQVGNLSVILPNNFFTRLTANIAEMMV